ncbi:MAG TPA: hypothetical protein VLH56_09005 [Dissulfurispiraceae bacterium]|nr:hypothetical protein [Dissulfurispiraceae bacterium]
MSRKKIISGESRDLKAWNNNHLRACSGVYTQTLNKLSGGQRLKDAESPARVLAKHIRVASFLIFTNEKAQVAELVAEDMPFMNPRRTRPERVILTGT